MNHNRGGFVAAVVPGERRALTTKILRNAVSAATGTASESRVQVGIAAPAEVTWASFSTTAVKHRQGAAMEIDVVDDGEQRRAGLRTRERQRADVGIKTVRPRYASLVVEEFDCCSGKFAMILKDFRPGRQHHRQVMIESLLLAVEGFDEVSRERVSTIPLFDCGSSAWQKSEQPVIAASRTYSAVGTTTLATTPLLRQPIRSASTRAGTPPIAPSASAINANVVDAR